MPDSANTQSKSISSRPYGLVVRAIAVIFLAFTASLTGSLLAHAQDSVESVQPDTRESDKQGPANRRSPSDEIIVTARLRDEPLQSVPVAVTAYSGQELNERGVTNLMEVGSFVPNTIMGFGQVGSGSGSVGQVFIRGVGQVDFLPTTDPGVVIYVDGVYHPRALGSVIDLHDLEQIEVLRGPQGTLFGKNAIGGAINIKTTRPSGIPDGYAELVTGSYDRLDVRAAVDFPIIADTLAGRVSFATRNRDAYASRLDFDTGEVLDETGDVDQTGARAALRWTPSHSMTIDLGADYSRERTSSVPTTLLQFDDAGDFGGVPIGLWNALIGVPNGTPMSSIYITGDEDTSYGTGPNNNELDSWGVDLNIDAGLGAVQLRSITAYREMEAEFGRDGDSSPLPILHTDEKQDQEQFSQEIQFLGQALDDQFDWLIGLFYLDEKAVDMNDVVITGGLYDALEALPGQVNGDPCAPPFTSPGCPGNPLNTFLDLELDVFNQVDITSYALFGQATWALTDRLNLTGGLRYSYDEKDYTVETLRIASDTLSIPRQTIGDDWSELTPMAAVDFQWAESLLVYLSAAEGYKSGGFNGRPISSIAEAKPYDPETLWSYELGLKSEWYNSRIRFNAAFFYYDYSDMQFSAAAADPDTGALILVVDNVGESDAAGFELEGTWQLTDHFRLAAQLGYIDFDITELEPTVADVTLDSVQPRTPEWTAGANAEYTWSIRSAGLLSMRVDWAYETESFSTIQNVESTARDEHHLLNARLTYRTLESGWEISLFGTNLLDERVVVSGAPSLEVTGTAEGFFNRPREWGLSVRKNFGGI